MHKGQRLKESKNVGGKKSLFLKMLTALQVKGKTWDSVSKERAKGSGERAFCALCPHPGQW